MNWCSLHSDVFVSEVSLRQEEGVLGGRGGQLKVSEPPCGPPNLHLMPIIRFQSRVLWEHPSCCRDYINDMFTIVADSF